MKKLIILAMVLSFMIMSLGTPLVFAAGPKTKAGPVQIQGTLEQVGTDYVIKDRKSTHNIVGDGLASFVGKKVVASGQWTKTEKGRVLKVEKIEEQISKKK